MRIQYTQREKTKSELLYTYWHNQYMPRPETEEDYEAAKNGDKDAFKQICSLRLIDMLQGRLK